MPTSKEIANWTAQGHWPPPEGITVLDETSPDPKEVVKLLKQLTQAVEPKSKPFVERAIIRAQKLATNQF